MKAFRLTRNLILAIALAVSLGANATLFVGGVIYSVVDEFVDQAFGLATDAVRQRKTLAALKTGSAKQAKALAASRAVAARQRGELSTSRAASARQRREIGKLNAVSAKQRREIAALKALSTKQGRALNTAKTVSLRQGRELAALKTRSARQAGALAASKAVAARQRGELSALRTDKGKLKELRSKIRNTVGPTAKRSRGRLVNSVARSILTAPGKALPYAGVAIVVGLTAWEIKDLCSTIRDLDEIQRTVGESKAEADSEPADCSRPDLAAKRAVAEMTKYSKEAWEENRKYLPDLRDWEDIPDWWRDAWRSTVPDILRGTLQGGWDGLKRFFR